MTEILIAPGQSIEATAVYAEWSDFVERVRSGETEGMEELYQLFSTGIRRHLAIKLGTLDLDDNVHDVFVIVVQAIRRGELRQAEYFMGFVHRVVQRQVEAHINQSAHRHHGSAHAMPSMNRQENPEEAFVFHERNELIKWVLAELSDRDREILTRLYVEEQFPEQICAEMSLTETQIRLLKSRVKARFGELGKRLVGSRGPDRETSESGNSTLDMSRIVPLIAHAVAVFGDENKASHWLMTRLPLLGDRSPTQLLESQEGLDLVDQILTRIEHNIPS